MFLAGNATYHNDSNRITDVTSQPGGASWVGALSMSGNVWNWTSSIASPYPYNATDGRENPNDGGSQRVMRGGSYTDDSEVLMTTTRGFIGPAAENPNVGFRCARSF